MPASLTSLYPVVEATLHPVDRYMGCTGEGRPAGRASWVHWQCQPQPAHNGPQCPSHCMDPIVDPAVNAGGAPAPLVSPHATCNLQVHQEALPAHHAGAREWGQRATGGRGAQRPVVHLVRRPPHLQVCTRASTDPQGKPAMQGGGPWLLHHRGEMAMTRAAAISALVAAEVLCGRRPSMISVAACPDR